MPIRFFIVKKTSEIQCVFSLARTDREGKWIIPYQHFYPTVYRTR